jgi:membrane complex biogenesis BtpA family protein
LPRNDARAALAVAAATGAAFIRINVHTGVMFADQGMIEGDAAQTLRERAVIAPNVAIFADHFVKHALPPAGTDAAQSAKDLRHRGLADALIVSGIETGAAPDADRLRIVREAVSDAPILIGSGLSDANTDAFADADGGIVGTAIKRGGRVEEPVERQRVERIVAAFKATGGR